jgi:hypothetical protein
MTTTDHRAAALAEALYAQEPHNCDDRMLNCAAAILAALAKKGIVLSLPNGDVTVPYDEIARLRRIEEAARDIAEGPDIREQTGDPPSPFADLEAENAALRAAAKAVVDAWDAEGYIGNDYLIAGVAAPMRDLRAALGDKA